MYAEIKILQKVCVCVFGCVFHNTYFYTRRNIYRYSLTAKKKKKNSSYLHIFVGTDPAEELLQQVCGHLARSRTPAESLFVKKVRKT